MTDERGPASAAEYASSAETALRGGKLRLAVEQISAALSLEPLHTRHLQLLEQILSAAPDAVAVTEVRGEAFFGRIAVHAWALARAGRLEEAIPLLIQPVVFRPEVPYLAWLRSWAKNKNALTELTDETLGAATSELLALTQTEPAARENLDAMVALLLATHHARKRGGDDPAIFFAGKLLRHLGALDEAEALLAEHCSATPSWGAFAELAHVRRLVGKIPAAIDALDRAIRLRPEEPTTYLDLGDLLLENGRFSDASTAYANAARCGDARPLVRACELHARAWAGDDRSLEELLQLPGDPAVQALVDDAAVLLRRLRVPEDGVTRVVRDALARASRLPSTSPVRVRVRASTAAPPSSFAAFRLGLARLSREGALHVEAEEEATTWSALWRKDAHGWVPAVPTPSAEITEAVLTLAKNAYEIDSWSLAARRAAEALPVEAMASALVHSPPPPASVETVDWVKRTQTAAAMILVWKAPDAAFALLRADEDWIADAIAIASLARARNDVAFRASAVAILNERLEESISPRHAWVLTVCRLRLGELGPEQLVDLWTSKRRLSEQL